MPGAAWSAEHRTIAAETPHRAVAHLAEFPSIPHSRSSWPELLHAASTAWMPLYYVPLHARQSVAGATERQSIPHSEPAMLRTHAPYANWTRVCTITNDIALAFVCFQMKCICICICTRAWVWEAGLSATCHCSYRGQSLRAAARGWGSGSVLHRGVPHAWPVPPPRRLALPAFCQVSGLNLSNANLGRAVRGMGVWGIGA